MVSWKLMASSTSRSSDLKRKQLSPRTSIDFLGIERSSSSGNDNLGSDTLTDDEILRSGSAEQNLSSDKDHRRLFGTEAESSNTLLSAEISLLDTVGTVRPISRCDSEPSGNVRKTADDVWKEIVSGKMSQKQPKEEMMTLEDFLLKAGAAEGGAAGSSGATGIVEVKKEGLSSGIYPNENIGVGVGGLGRGRRSLSLLEPLDKAAEQRQRRMIKNRESAARSRERKQAYQVELESMAMRLEEENDRLLKEKAERRRKRLKQLMENVIPVAEKRRPPRFLRKVRSMQW
ncbi:hypothetical protein CDL12_24555 [Handroanthus impetiginosus]|uniref:BZIP domain-containing protein n=1 Tax=Handroanthus impetiginosus TaxID=429701 RepID=A0A2G9GCJ5_9LAMI|nr:hypothetical protein CDL12_24555 [Handroanthus impetiginosus]